MLLFFAYWPLPGRLAVAVAVHQVPVHRVAGLVSLLPHAEELDAFDVRGATGHDHDMAAEVRFP